MAVCGWRGVKRGAEKFGDPSCTPGDAAAATRGARCQPGAGGRPAAVLRGPRRGEVVALGFPVANWVCGVQG